MGGNYVVSTVATFFIKRVEKEATVFSELLYSAEENTEAWQ